SRRPARSGRPCGAHGDRGARGERRMKMKTLACIKTPVLASVALALNGVVSGPAATRKGERAPMYRIASLGAPREKATEPRASEQKRRRIAALRVPDTIAITVPNVNTGVPESVPAHPTLMAVNAKGEAVGHLFYTPPSSGATPDRSVP